MNSQSALNPYLLSIPAFIAEHRLRDRQVVITQRVERKLQRCLSLTEIEVDMDMRWRSRFMSREQKRFIDSDFLVNRCNYN
jgi:hypothetical protein